ncbi:hypothetical protein LDENG_00285190 [Lucifuga dentata]|nr:hypothetical protein LDENG_00285190 [Lucifuga dentata]
MEMEEDSLTSQDIKRAKAFWAAADVDHVFDHVLLYLDHLRTVLKRNVATDKEYVKGLKLLSCLDYAALSPEADTVDASVVQVVIGSEGVLPAGFSQQSPPSSPNPDHGSAAPPADAEELLSALYKPHTCSAACLPALPSMPQYTPLFWAQNPLKVPLLCGFQRVSDTQLMSSPGGGDCETETAGSQQEEGTVYKAPCGLSLRNHRDVMCFLLATESYDVLQMDFFSFNPAVRLDPPPLEGPRRPELDLSRGMEPTPVELCPRDEGARPASFRYRKDRWPHGCFLNHGPQLFSTCCDCTGSCSDAERCACVNLTRGGRHYSHNRLSEPVPSGVYECGPWCDCDRALCQNRLVQRGIRVRLQVFQTDNRGWGVRCRDDLDCGTFVCMYAGVLLRRVERPVETPPPKLTRADFPSDDEVEVVTEWVERPVQEGQSELLETPPPLSLAVLPPLYVPVIQRPAECASMTLDRDEIQTVLVGLDPQPSSPVSKAEQSSEQEMNGSNVKPRVQRSSKRTATVEDVYLLDASKEGNVGRFINHSCQPNLFVQNVFTDSHDPRFPLVAFFTNRAVTAGTELTWDYSSDTGSTLQQQQEVPCLCGSDGCRGHITIENLCEVCEVEGHGSMEAQ